MEEQSVALDKHSAARDPVIDRGPPAWFALSYKKLLLFVFALLKSFF